MSDEFNKLDLFMKRNIPSDAKPIAVKSIKMPPRMAWKTLALGIGMCSLVAVYMVQKNDHMQAEARSELEEMLAWDATSDEFSADFENSIAMLDY